MKNTSILNTTRRVAVSGLFFWTILSAEPLSFNFEDPKGVNNVTFSLDAPLESISGTASGISGLVQFDPEKPVGLSGEIVVAAKSLVVPNNSMLDHIQSKGWLDIKKYKTMSFLTESVSEVKQKGNTVEVLLHGVFTLKGQSKKLSIPAKFVYLPGKLKDRSNGRMDGDLLVIRARFSINRSDFGIKPGEYADKVAEEIELKLSIAGYHAK